MKIVFMGTPDFAVASLEAIIKAGLNVVAVITAPDKPAGRGLELKASEIKNFALLHHIPVLQPVKLKDPEFISDLQSYQADLGVVVAFRMLPEMVWKMFPKGTFNVHASLLPQYRGAAPINHAIINGEKVTGVSTFFLQHEIDTGDIITQKLIEIAPNEIAGELHDRLKEEGALLAVETINLIISNEVNVVQQKKPIEVKEAPKIFKEFCRINFNQPAETVHNHIRGLSPFPAAYTFIHIGNKKLMLKILRTAVLESNIIGQSATFESDGKSFLHVFCKTGSLNLIALQPEGKKKMGIKDFLNGIKDINLLVFDH